METKFQTSFIPKKPVVQVGGATMAPKRHTTSLFMTFSGFIFAISLLAAGGAYAWKYYLESAQQTAKEELSIREREFNVDLIEQLKRANVRIDISKKLLDSHLATSQIFDIISRMTIANVRFTSLNLEAPKSSADGIKLTMKGYGSSLSAVAFQSDVLNQLEQYGLRKIVRNPILSGPSLDPTGTVSFDFSATIDPAGLSYVHSVEPPPVGGNGSAEQ